MSKPRIIVSYSGGKDSQACLIQAANKYGADKIEAIFSDTGFEHPITYKRDDLNGDSGHVVDVCRQMGVKLTVIRHKELDFEKMCLRMKSFPNANRRACTSILKIEPMIDWVIEQPDHLIIIQGIRDGESQARAKMKEECSYFKEYFNPAIKGQYRKKAVKEWCKIYDASVMRPIFKWTSQEVIDYILDNGQRPCKLYERGASRVGCFPCIMARHSELKVLAKDKEMADRLIKLEQDVNNAGDKKPATFFTSGTIPERFCRTYGNGCPTVQEVLDYVCRDDAMENLFKEQENQSCMSLYHGLCE